MAQDGGFAVRNRAAAGRFDPPSAAHVSLTERVGDLFRMPVARAWLRWRRSMGLPIAVASSSNLQLNHSIGLGIGSAPAVRPASNGEPREQAHLPAEQPSPRQDARLPSAHAHARRPRHHHCPSSQGPLRALGLRPTCCRHVTACVIGRTSRRQCEDQVPAERAGHSSSCMPTGPMRGRIFRRASVLLCPRLLATR